MRSWQWAMAAIGVVTAVPLFVPQALAFPYKQTRGPVTIWSDTPVSPAIDLVIARADRLVAASPLATGASGRHIVLTNGGWRWQWLALTASQGFGLTWPLSEAVILNRSDVDGDRIHNGVNGRLRTLSGTMAHERTHTLIRARLGIVRAALLPLWVREGYPDYVARESSLSDRDAASLRRTDPGHLALAYYDGRRRVAATLATNGGSVDRMLRDAAP